MLKLLIVDDEKRTREGLKRCISWESINIKKVEEADDGSSALAIAEEFKPDIILCDIKMPNMGGIEFISRLREKNELKPNVIFISGYSDKEYLKSAIQLKAINYVEKPININELEKALKDAADACIKDKQNIIYSRQSEAIKPIIEQELVLQLSEPVYNRGELTRKLILLGNNIPIDGNYVAVGFKLFYNHSATGNENLELNNKFIYYLKNIFNEHNLKNIMGIKDKTYILAYIHITTVINFYTIKKLLNTIISKCNNYIANAPNIGKGVSIGVGLSVNGMENLHRSVQQAMTVSQNSFFNGMGKVYLFECGDKSTYYFDANLKKLFKDTIASGEIRKLLIIVDELADKLKKYQDTPINNIKLQFYELLMVLCEESEKRNINISNCGERKEILWGIISKFSLLDEIKDFLKNKIGEYLDAIEEINSSSKIIYEVIQYINNNYHKKDISLEEISTHVYITPSYLCQLFKREIGKTINEYLTEYRIDKSKELLMERQTKIYQISSMVGYKDSKYFSRIFKDIIGMTPTEFREMG